LAAPQQLLQWQDQRVRRGRPAQPETRAKTQIDAARMKISELKKHDERKIKELRKPALETATIQVAQAASMSLQLRMEERAASETNRLTGNLREAR